MQFIITNDGFSAIQNAQIQGIQLVITNYQLGSAVNYTPEPSMDSLQGTLLYTGGVGGFQVINQQVIQYDLVIGPGVGTFEFGEVALLLSDGTVFALASLPELQSKRAATATTSGNTVVVQAQVIVTNANTTFTFTLSTNQEAQLPSLATVDALVPVSGAVANAFLCAVGDNFGNPTLALQDANDRWRFSTHSFPLIEDASIIQAQANSVTINITLDQLKLGGSDPTAIELGEYLVSFTDGLNAGYVREVQSVTLANGNTQATFTFDQALPQASNVGDTFTIFKANAAILQEVVEAAAYTGLEVEMLAGTPPQWAYVTDLPATDDPTNLVKLEVVVFGGTPWSSSDLISNTYGIGSAGGINVMWEQIGSGRSSGARLQIYENSNGTFSVYVYFEAPNDNLVAGVGAKIISSSLFDDLLIPSTTTTQPTGTLVYDSLNYNPAFIVDGFGNITGNALTLNTNGGTSSVSLTNSGANGVNISLTGNSSASTNKGVSQKYIRAYNGYFQIMNGAYSQAIMSLDDVGNVVFQGQISGASGYYSQSLTVNGTLTGTNIASSGVANLGTVNVAQNETVAGDLTVNGTTYLGNTEVANLDATDTQVDGTLLVTGAANFQGDISGKTAGYNPTGLNIGWNFTTGQGEVDLLLGPQGGSGGLSIFQLDSNGNIIGGTPILSLSSTGALGATSLEVGSITSTGPLQVSGNATLNTGSIQSLTAANLTVTNQLTSNQVVSAGYTVSNNGAIQFSGSGNGYAAIYSDPSSSSNGPNDLVIRTGTSSAPNYAIFYKTGGLYVPGPITCSPATNNGQAVTLNQLLNGQLNPVFGSTSVGPASQGGQAVQLKQLMNGSLSADFGDMSATSLTLANPASQGGQAVQLNQLLNGSLTPTLDSLTVNGSQNINGNLTVDQTLNSISRTISPEFISLAEGSFLFNLGSDDGTSNVVLRSDGNNVYMYPWGIPYGELIFGNNDPFPVRINGSLTVNQPVSAPNGNSGNQLVNYSQFSNMQSFGGQDAIYATDTTVTVTVTFTAPCDGTIFAVGSRNLSSEAGFGNNANLYINYQNLGSDNTTLSMTHMASLQVSGGTYCVVQYESASPVPFSVHIGYVFVPNVSSL